MKPSFINMRVKDEMNFFARWIWWLFGKKHQESSELYKVTAYSFKNITLIWEVKYIGEE